jgi:hypothetical protein
VRLGVLRLGGGGGVGGGDVGHPFTLQAMVAAASLTEVHKNSGQWRHTALSAPGLAQLAMSLAIGRIDPSKYVSPSSGDIDGEILPRGRNRGWRHRTKYGGLCNSGARG